MTERNTASGGGSNLAGGRPTGQEAFFNTLHRKGYPIQGHSASPGLPIYVTGPNGRKCAGHVISRHGRRILRKTGVVQAKHFCRVHQGYGVELDALRQAEKLGVTGVRLVTDKGTLDVSLAAFSAYGVRDTLGGFGVQVFLPVGYWTHTPAEAR